MLASASEVPRLAAHLVSSSVMEGLLRALSSAQARHRNQRLIHCVFNCMHALVLIWEVCLH